MFRICKLIKEGKLAFYRSDNIYLKNLRGSNLTVVSAYSFTHSLGKQVSTKLVRNQIDLGYLYKNDHYDNQYLNYFNLSPRINITQVYFFDFN
jgi:hypothetical protein